MGNYANMNWYSWISLAAFDAWHSTVCNGLGIPHPNYNAATGEIDSDAAWTTKYTDVYEVAPDDWRAIVYDDIANDYSDGLGAPSEAPPSPLEVL